LGVNNAFQYPNYFAMIPTGPDPNAALTEGFFAVAAEQSPKPRTVVMLAADAEFARNPVLGGKANATKYGFNVVHELSYPLGTKNFRPFVDRVAEFDCDVLFLCSYLDDSVGLVHAINEHWFRAKLVGGAMIGPQNTDVKLTLGPLLNGFVNYEYWVPGPGMMFPGVVELLRTTKPAPRPLALTRSGITWRRWPTHSCRCSAKRSRLPAASMMRTCPPTPAQRRSTR
jgi:branched-chain amino acid transport system substrate-binding protein